jgi:hypothetical protein
VIETMLPKWTLAVRSGVILRCAFGRCTIDTVPVIRLDLDKGGMVHLGMRSTAEGTAHTLGVALVGVMAPPLTPSAQQRAGMRFHSGDPTIDFPELNEFSDEGSRIGATHGVMNIDPCSACIRMSRVPHYPRNVFNLFG